MTCRYTPIPENEFYSTVLARIYDPNQPAGFDQDPIDSHRLAVLYMVFALGTLFDLEKPYLSVEATQYYQLARASLSIDSVLEHQTIPAIQALVSVFPYLCGRPDFSSDVHGVLLITREQVLMCHFMFMSFRDGPRWALMGLVVKLTQGVSCPDLCTLFFTHPTHICSSAFVSRVSFLSVHVKLKNNYFCR